LHETDEARLTEIETLLAFQEQTIEDLSQVIRRQQAEIDELGRRLNLLVEKLQAANAES
jgi:uncharacterized coiled-coil protein SlyX